MLSRPMRLAIAADVADDVLLAGLGCVADDGVRDFCVVEDLRPSQLRAHWRASVVGLSPRKTKPRSAPVRRRVYSIMVVRMSSSTRVLLKLCAAWRKRESFSSSVPEAARRHPLEERLGGGVVVCGDEEEGDAGRAELNAVTGMEASSILADVVDEGPVEATEILQ